MIKITRLSVLAIFLSLCYTAQLQQTSTECKGFPCRDLGILGFPFFSGMRNKCGLIEVDCYNKKIKLGNEYPWYDVLTLSHQGRESPYNFEICDTLLQEGLKSKSCEWLINNTTIIHSPLISSNKRDTNTSSPLISFDTSHNSYTELFMCTGNSSAMAEYFNGYYNYTGCSGYYLYYAYPYDLSDYNVYATTIAALPPTCSIIPVPVLSRMGGKIYSDLFQFVTPKLNIQWRVSAECSHCYNIGGACSINNHQEFHCIGGNMPRQGIGMIEKDMGFLRTRLGVQVLIGTIGTSIVILIGILFSLRRKIAILCRKIAILCRKIAIMCRKIAIMCRKIAMMIWRNTAVVWRKKITNRILKLDKNLSSPAPKRYRYIRNIMMNWRRKTKNQRTIKNFLKNYGSIGPRRYKYSEIKKMTNCFKDKLGEGGYGSVYKGKLSNGNLVAVKVIKESKGDGEEFFNEVASISRTSHVNVVTLLGFCIEGRKRALLYEFMPNGSLERFLEGQGGVSSAHCKLSSDKSYRIAIGIARGLEYLHRGCNTRILHFDIKPHNILLDEDFVPKISDFGLSKLCPPKESGVSMLNPRGTIGYIAPEVFHGSHGRVSHKSDVYSYGMMVLEMVGCTKNMEVEVGHSSEIYFPDWIYKKLESDEEVENVYDRMMIIVSLWCIQSNPSTRPSMSRVVEMLEGSLESLDIPLKPVLSSPPLPFSMSSTIDTD